MKLSPRIVRARRKRRLWFVTSCLLAAALAGIGHWLWKGRYWVVTDNAFVVGNVVPVEADANGTIVQIFAEETQHVQRGELLARLDGSRAQAALGQSRGELGRTVREIAALYASCGQLREKLAARSARLARVRHDALRFRQAVAEGAESEQSLQNAEDQIQGLEAETRETDAELKALIARTGGVRPDRHPAVEAAKHRFLDAYVEFVRQEIRAPTAGYVAVRKAQVGDRVRPGDALFTLVPLDYLWVEANLRETELQQIGPGQRAEVAVDLYGKKHAYSGTVEGIAPGAGSVFALLPPDNAVGNFIHIVQRVPVRIALRKDELLQYPLRPGLSTVTAIYVGESGDSATDSRASVSADAFKTDIFAGDLAAAEAEANAVVQANRIAPEDAAQVSCLADSRKSSNADKKDAAFALRLSR